MKWIYRIVVAVVALAGAAIVLAYATALTGERPVGFEITQAADADGTTFPVGVWYPTTEHPWPTAQIGVVLMNVARNAPVTGRDLPLVVISHGNGGGPQSHADLALALASAGYVVAAPMHAGDNFLDSGAAGSANLFGARNRQLRSTIEHLLAKWPGHVAIDAEKIGAFGFSAGGFTVLTVIGARPDLRRVAEQCARASEFVCEVLRHFRSPLVEPGGATGGRFETSPRIRAAVLAAPGLGFTFDPATLSDVPVPVQLWSGDQDDKVPYATNARIIGEGLGPTAEVHRVPGASHTSFLVPCGLLRPAELCDDPGGFDRPAFHRTMNAAVVAFFDRTLRHRRRDAGAP